MSDVGGSDEEQTLSASVHAKRFECGHHGIAVENGINAFHDVSRDIQEINYHPQSGWFEDIGAKLRG